MSLLSLFLVLTLTFVEGDLFHGRTDFVTELTFDAYKEIVDSDPTGAASDWVVLHYSAMCGHCIRFVPDFIEIATAFRPVTRLRFGAIDLSEPANRPLIAEKNIRHVPLIQLFQIVERDTGFSDRQSQTLVPNRRFLVAMLESIYAGNDALADQGSGFADNPATTLLNDPVSFVRDAALSLWAILSTSVFKGNSTFLEEDDVRSLRHVLHVCESAFEIRSIAEACGKLKSAVDSNGGVNLSRRDWESALEANKDLFPQLIRNSPQSSLSSCSTMTCALWRLLHLYSLGKGGSPSVAISPSDAMLAIHIIVDKFFLCQECREHFLAHYDNCDYGRCVSPSPAWKQTTLWLWELHNAVTARVYTQRSPWPSETECPACINNPAATFDYLWSRFSLAGSPLSMNQDNNSAQPTSISFIHILVTIFLIFL